MWYSSMRLLGWSLIPALFRLRVFGRENLPENGGVLIASNHQSYLDPVMATLGLKRQVDFMAREELFRVPGFGAFIRSLGAFPVKPGARDTAAIRRAVDRLRNGSTILIFPEGTRSFDGSLQPLLPGFTIIAARSQAPVVPAVIYGAHRAWPRGQTLFTLRNVWVAYGEPLTFPRWPGDTRDSFLKEIKRRMENLHRFLRRVSEGESARSELTNCQENCRNA